MEEYMNQRPERVPFPKDVQKKLIERVKEFVRNQLLPNQNINKIILFGSLATGEFGKYEGQFQGRIFSDIDLLLLVENTFQVPGNWRIQYEGELYNIYNAGLLDGFLIQYMVCKRSVYENPDSQIDAEDLGVPLLKKTKHKHIVLYKK